MFIQATIFDTISGSPTRIPDIPDFDRRIQWQGIGDDEGWVSVHGNGENYLVQDLAGHIEASANFTNIQTNDTLNPLYIWNKTEWVGGYSRFAVSGGWNGHGYTTYSKLAGWRPREWEFPYVSADYGASSITGVGSRWYGDDWYSFDGGLDPVHPVARGINRRLPSGVSGAEAGYVPPAMYVYSGKGDGLAGEYEKTTDPTEKKVLGWWSESENKYVLGNTVSALGPSAEPGHVSPFNVSLNLGIYRPHVDPVTQAWEISPSGWDFEGASWDAPSGIDPMDIRYWDALRQAILERESVIPEHTMGTLFEFEHLINGPQVLKTPEMQDIYTYQRMIYALSTQYTDLAAASATLFHNHVLLYNDDCSLAGKISSACPGLYWGFTEKDPMNTWDNTVEYTGSVAGFLSDAKKALQMMTILPTSRYIYHWVYDSTIISEELYSVDGESYQSTWVKALQKERFEPFWRRSDNVGVWHGLPNAHHTQMLGWGLISRYNSNEYMYTLLSQYNNKSIMQANVPNTSVLDGSQLAPPEIRWIRWSQPWSEDIHVGDPFQEGVVDRIVYVSDYSVSGYSEGTTTLPFSYINEFPGEAPAPTTPGLVGDVNYCLWGNWTDTYTYYDYSNSFKFR